MTAEREAVGRRFVYAAAQLVPFLGELVEINQLACDALQKRIAGREVCEADAKEHLMSLRLEQRWAEGVLMQLLHRPDRELILDTADMTRLNIAVTLTPPKQVIG